jgi:hypothetical protein
MGLRIDCSIVCLCMEQIQNILNCSFLSRWLLSLWNGFLFSHRSHHGTLNPILSVILCGLMVMLLIGLAVIFSPLFRTIIVLIVAFFFPLHFLITPKLPLHSNLLFCRCSIPLTNIPLNTIPINGLQLFLIGILLLLRKHLPLDPADVDYLRHGKIGIISQDLFAVVSQEEGEGSPGSFPFLITVEDVVEGRITRRIAYFPHHLLKLHPLFALSNELLLQLGEFRYA